MAHAPRAAKIASAGQSIQWRFNLINERYRPGFGGPAEQPAGSDHWPRFQFTLRTLLVVLTLTASIAGYCANYWHRRARAIAVICNAGGRCLPADEREPDRRGSAWLFFAGPDGPIASVDISHTALSGNDFARIRDLSEIDRLVMRRAQLPTTWGESAMSLKQLRHLALDHTTIQDSDLALLRFWPGLETLTLANTAITDWGIRYVANCPNIERLILDQVLISDKGIAFLGRMPKLRDLYLIETRITNEALETIGEIKSLRFLNLNRCCVSDDGLRFLVGLSQLEEVVLEGTAVTNKGLMHLEALRSLKRIYLANTAVTAEGASRLQQAMPRCTVDR